MIIRWRRVEGNKQESYDGHYRIRPRLDERNAPMYYHLFIGDRMIDKIFWTKGDARKYAEERK